MRPSHWFYTIPLRLRSLLRRKNVERELDEELQFHLDSHMEEQMARGMAPEDARRSALRAIGGLGQRKEECRDMRRMSFVDHLIQDLRYAGRMLRKSPAFTAVAISSLALGIGSNTAIFSLVNAVLLRSLPVGHPEQLVLVTAVSGDGYSGNFAYPDYQLLRDRNGVFSGLIASNHLERSDVGVGSEIRPADGEIVSGNYFAVLGVRPLLGRTFAQGDEAAPVVVIGYNFWRRELSGDPSVLGKTVTINGAPCTITGVAPPEFFGESAGYVSDFWVPLGLQKQVYSNHQDDLKHERSVSWLDVMGRLRPGATIGQADANMKVLVSQIHTELGIKPDRDYLHHITLEPGRRGSARLRQKFSDPLRILMGVVTLVLLIACTNLASLLIARSAARQREMATRLAIGASRGRLVRQILTENLVLALAGGMIGFLFSLWGARVLLALVNRNGGSITLDLRPDRHVLIFTASMSVLTGVLCGVAPALRATGRHAGRGLHLGSRAIGRERRWGLGTGLVVAQVALSLVLVAGGGLLIATLRNLKTLDLGFQADHVLLVGLHSSRDGYRGPDAAGLASRLLERVSPVPGVRSASVSFLGALGNGGSNICCIQIDGYTPSNRQDQRLHSDWVGPDYFRTLGIPLMAGREFSAADTPTSPKVAVVNETTARHYFGDRPAVGRRFQWVNNSLEIVGVVKDSKLRDLREESGQRTVYFPFLQRPAELGALEVQTLGSPLALAGTVRQAIREVDPKLHIEIASMAGRIDRKLATEHLLAELSGFFSGLTLLLVSIGVYGTLAYSVARRTNEIGVRMALGAQAGTVLRMVLRDVLLMLAPGVLMGVAVVLACGRLIASMLFGLKASDAATISLAASVLIAVSLAAAYIPARRASRVDPLAALRFE
jgi:predicted permease